MRLPLVSKLGTRERPTLRLLRGAGRGGAAPATLDAFARLHARARECGAVIHDARSIYASENELCLLGLLAINQRSQLDFSCKVERRLRPALRACARCLTDEGLELGYNVALRLTVVADEKLVQNVRPMPRDGPSDKSRRRESRCLSAPSSGDRSLTEALVYVRLKGLVTSYDLQRLGLSRQVISQMCKNGVLRSLRTGVYYSTVDMRTGAAL